MANKSSFLLAILFIANPFVLLFYQNCSVQPAAKSADKSFHAATKKLASDEKPDESSDPQKN